MTPHPIELPPRAIQEDTEATQSFSEPVAEIPEEDVLSPSGMSSKKFSQQSFTGKQYNVLQAAVLQARLNGERLALMTLVTQMSEHDTRWIDRVASALIGRFDLYLFRCGHIVVTAIIWFHFFYWKFSQQKKGVPSGAPNYWWKRLTPPIEFGLMHAILFQLVLIPLTMSRHLLAYLAATPIRHVIPFEHIVDFHIFIGYVFCAVMVGSVVLFVAFFGKVCADFNQGEDPANLCEKFTDEIMLTGYGILACTLIVLFSSFFRGRLPYEVFYVLHHFVFAMFALATAHTMDVEFRNDSKVGLARSQNFRWFSTSLVIYLVDRIYANVVAYKAVKVRSTSSTYDSSTLVLALRKPDGFKFRCGQHAYLRVSAIDCFWHPFSISSAPSSGDLRFIIEIQGSGSWTQRLLEICTRSQQDGHVLHADVMGPFGSTVSDDNPYHKILAVGTGTGIVPMMSLMNAMGDRLRQLNPQAFLNARAYLSDVRRDLHANLQIFQLRFRLKMMRKHGTKCAYMRKIRQQIQRQRFGALLDVWLFFLLQFELWLLCATVSWPNLRNGLRMSTSMADVLCFSTLIAICLYCLICIFYSHSLSERRKSHSFSEHKKPGYLSALETIALGAMVTSWVLWTASDTAWRSPDAFVQILRAVLSLWRLLGLWRRTPKARLAKHARNSQTVEVHSRFELLWITKSADLLVGFLPELELMHLTVADAFGGSAERFHEVFGLTIHCTDSNPEKIAHLRRLLRDSPLRRHIFLKRPNLQATIIRMMGNEIRDSVGSAQGSSQVGSSLVTFCGSPTVATICRSAVLAANMLADQSGTLKVPRLLFREEFYGLTGKVRETKPQSEWRSSLITREFFAGLSRTPGLEVRTSEQSDASEMESKWAKHAAELVEVQEQECQLQTELEDALQSKGGLPDKLQAVPPLSEAVRKGPRDDHEQDPCENGNWGYFSI